MPFEATIHDWSDAMPFEVIIYDWPDQILSLCLMFYTSGLSFGVFASKRRDIRPLALKSLFVWTFE